MLTAREQGRNLTMPKSCVSARILVTISPSLSCWIFCRMTTVLACMDDSRKQLEDFQSWSRVACSICRQFCGGLTCEKAYSSHLHSCDLRSSYSRAGFRGTSVVHLWPGKVEREQPIQRDLAGSLLGQGCVRFKQMACSSIQTHQLIPIHPLNHKRSQ